MVKTQGKDTWSRHFVKTLGQDIWSRHLVKMFYLVKCPTKLSHQIHDKTLQSFNIFRKFRFPWSQANEKLNLHIFHRGLIDKIFTSASLRKKFFTSVTFRTFNREQI